jgi:hypothetical protein
MKFVTHNDKMLDAAGMSLKGSIDATYSQLVRTFGKPEPAYDKSRAEWTILFDDGTIATIYDWKETIRPIEAVTRWNVGGKTFSAYINVLEVLR